MVNGYSAHGLSATVISPSSGFVQLSPDAISMAMACDWCSSFFFGINYNYMFHVYHV